MKIAEDLRAVGDFVLGVSLATLVMVLAVFAAIHIYLDMYPAQAPLPASEMFGYDNSGPVSGTGSMLPAIWPSSILYYKLNFSLRVGDIYVYQAPDKNYSVVHRLLYKDGDWCFFKGDNNQYMDTKLNCSNVLKKVVAIQYR